MTDEEYRQKAKGLCYPNSFQILMEVSEMPREFPNAKLCHGVAVLSREPYCEFGHAWIEVEVRGEIFVIDHLYPDHPVSRNVYYQVGKVREHTVRRYTLNDARILSTKKNPFGPWCPVIAAAAHAELI
jgi:hypothetical protein